MKMRLGAIFLIAASLAITHSAAGMTGKELHELCKSTNEFKRGYCSGKINGYFDGYWRGRVLGAVSGAMWHANKFKSDKKMIVILSPRQSDELVKYVMKYCPPKHTTRSQVVTVGAEYLADHPERGSDDIDDLLADAFEEAWPCEK